MNTGSSSYLMRVALIPTAVFLSALFGGAYGSGREVVEFISQHGPVGGFLAIATIVAVYAICLFLVFEIGRLHSEYEYRGFAKKLLGKGSILYEILIAIGLLLGLAICASAGGAIFESHFGMPSIAGGMGILLIIVTLTFFGRKIVEDSMIAAISALGLLLVYLLFVVLTSHGGEVSAAFSGSDIATAGIGTGLKYALTNCGFLPVLLYCSRDLHSRKEVASAAGFAAAAGVIPAIAFHLSFMMAYPQIVGLELPTYWLIETIMPALFLNAYVVVVFVLVAQTGVALLQGVIESLDKILLDRRQVSLPPIAHAAVSGAAVLLASLFASVGLVQLIIGVYGFLSISFLVVFYLPLLTRGVYLVAVDSRIVNERA